MILVSGGKGQLAKEISKSLQGSGFSVVELSKDDLDVTKLTSLETNFEKFTPQVFVNCAAITNVDFAELNPDLTYATNSVSAFQISALCNRFNTNLIHISSDYVFDGYSMDPYIFNSEMNPISNYGRSKALAEMIYARNLKVDYSVIRTGSIYGGEKANFLKRALDLLKDDKQVKLAHNQSCQPTSTRFLSEAICLMIERSIYPGVVHLTSRGRVSKLDFVRFAAKQIGISTSNILEVEFAHLPNSRIRPQFLVLDEPRFQELGIPRSPFWQEELENILTTISQ